MKIYKSIFRSFTFAVPVNGQREYITFKDKGMPYAYGVYYCNDKAVAAAIEASPYFGHSVFLLEDNEAGADKQETSEPAPAAVYENVKRTQEANKILVNEYGIDRSRLSSRDDALAVAKELNISFPNL